MIFYNGNISSENRAAGNCNSHHTIVAFVIFEGFFMNCMY